jgi:hypothetical protein
MKSLKGSIKLLTLTVPMLALTGCVTPSAQPTPQTAANEPTTNVGIKNPHPPSGDNAVFAPRKIFLSIAVAGIDGCSKDERDIIAAKDCLQSHFMPYRDHIAVIAPDGAGIGEIEKEIGCGYRPNTAYSLEQQAAKPWVNRTDAAVSSYFLTVVMQDLKAESDTVQVGNTMVKRTNYTRKAVAKVRDHDGNVIFALNVVGKSTHRRTSATQNKGHDPSSDIMEDIMKRIADRVAEEFLCELTVRIKAPTGDAEFDTDEVVLYLDGKEFENGGTVIAGKHLLLAQCDGYKDVVRPIELRGGKKRIIAVKFAKAAPKQDQDASGKKADPESK